MEIGDMITVGVPILAALVIYFVRLETRLTKILTDLCWIKKELKKNANDPGA